MATTEEFLKWVKAAPISDVIPKRPLSSVPADASLMSVLEQLASLKVHSLPVIHPSRGTVLGMVDVLDIVCSVYDLADLERFNKDGSFDAGDVAAAFIDTKPLREKLAAINAIRMIRKAAPGRAEVIASLPATFEGPEMPNYNVTVNDTVYDLLAKLGWGAIHRVPVLAPTLCKEVTGANESTDSADGNSETGTHEMVDVLCQSDLLLYLAGHMATLPDSLLRAPISDFATNVLCKVGLNSSMAEALWLFKQRKVLALVVEDHNGGFVGPISAKDFTWRASDLSIYGMAVDEFMDVKGMDGGQRADLMLPANATIADALSFLATKKQYRVWLTEGEKCPHTQRPIVTGVLSIRDIVKALWRVDPANSKKTVCQD